MKTKETEGTVLDCLSKTIIHIQSFKSQLKNTGEMDRRSLLTAVQAELDLVNTNIERALRQLHEVLEHEQKAEGFSISTLKALSVNDISFKI